MSKITRVLVTSETELEIHIPDHLLTNEALAEFSSGMFHVDGPADMYRYVASQLAARPYPHFIEGVGPAEFMEQPLSTAVVGFKVVDIDTSAVFTGGTIDRPIHPHLYGE
jgi:hypothetical protein